MYDAWAAYDAAAVGTTDILGIRRRPAKQRNDANKKKAISFAAYRCLTNLYPDAASVARLGTVLTNHGYDLSETSKMNPRTPAGVGNIAAQAVIDARANDGWPDIALRASPRWRP